MIILINSKKYYRHIYILRKRKREATVKLKMLNLLLTKLLQCIIRMIRGKVIWMWAEN